MKLLSFFVVFLLCATFAAAECVADEEVTKQGLKARSKYFVLRAEGTSLMMEAVINVLGDAGATTDEVEAHKADFDALLEDAEAAVDAEDREAFQAAIADGKATVKAFREEARSLGEEFSVDKTTVKAAIDDILEENKETFSRAKKDALTDSRKYRETKFSRNLCRLEAKAAEKGVELDKEAFRDRQEALRKAYTAALEACGDVSLKTCEEDEAQDYVALRDELNDHFKSKTRAIRDHRAEVREERAEAREERRAERNDTRSDRLEERRENRAEKRAEHNETRANRVEERKARAEQRRDARKARADAQSATEDAE